MVFNKLTCENKYQHLGSKLLYILLHIKKTHWFYGSYNMIKSLIFSEIFFGHMFFDSIDKRKCNRL
jgi:hypothetical protein